MAGPKTLRSLSKLLTYPDSQTVEAAEVLYIILQGELPEAAKCMSEFGAFLEQNEHWQIEEAFANTFDLNPECALEVGWHLFGEEYSRGLFLVRMREELRKYGLDESVELPDHITHVLELIGAMPEDEATKFVTSCVLPSIKKLYQIFENNESPYRNVISCLALVLNHVWGEGSSLTDGSEFTREEGVDLLHGAYPVADVDMGCGSGGCGSGGCGSSGPSDLISLDIVGLSSDPSKDGNH